jgi:hypothetical protein
VTALALDHYNGRTVEDVNRGEGEWQIVLIGNVRIINYDEVYEMPEKADLEGKMLQRVTMSNDRTVLQFGTNDAPMTVEAQLSSLHYGIADPDRIEGVFRPLTERKEQ